MYNKWCGINLIRVIVRRIFYIASEGNNLINSLLQVLESLSTTTTTSSSSSNYY